MPQSPDFNPAARFVRIVQVREDGMVEFEFAVGEPEIYVEMIMPRAQFEEFCRDQGVTPTEAPATRDSADQPLDEFAHELTWNLRSAREHAGSDAFPFHPDLSKD